MKDEPSTQKTGRYINLMFKKYKKERVINNSNLCSSTERKYRRKRNWREEKFQHVLAIQHGDMDIFNIQEKNMLNILKCTYYTYLYLIYMANPNILNIHEST